MPTTETQKQFIQTQKRSRRRITLARLALFILFLLAWETAAGTGQIDPFIFSSPSRVFRTFLTMWQEEQLALQIGITLAETLISFFLVVFSPCPWPSCSGCVPALPGYWSPTW